MKAFLDTSVLVATSLEDHEFHERSLDLFLRFGKKNACCGAHSLAEIYGTLTGRLRVAPHEALLFLDDVRDHLTIVSLDSDEYLQSVRTASANGLIGGVIYDALLAACALKARAETIYTWNPRDFVRVSPEVASRVHTP